VDYLALLGDQADNIKGVHGIGAQKAQTLVYQYQTIENMYDHLDFIDPSVAKILAENKESAFNSKSLIQLAQVDLSGVSLENLKFHLNYEEYQEILCGQH
jgi:DNA polymerase-1